MLLKNDIYNQNGVDLRILEIRQAEDVAWVFPVAHEKALPFSVQYSNIASRKPVPSVDHAPARRPSETGLRRARKAWARIEPLVANPGIFLPQERNHAINERAAELRCSPQTLFKDLRRYWAGGQTMAALAGRFEQCGKVSDETPERVRGRKPVYSDYDIYSLTAPDKKNMEEVIRREYLKGTTVATIPAAYQRLLEDHYSYLDGNRVRQTKMPGEAPTLGQFRYFMERNFSLEERLRKRIGDKNFERNHRSRLSPGLQDCLGIGHIYEIDATVADVWLVSSKSRAAIIGKPTMYLIYDKYSRLVVGFYVGLEAASWVAAKQAIISIAEDKAAMCLRYGVPYDAADWPATGVFPQTFLGDRGEMISRDSSLLSENMQTTVKNSVALRPDRKWTVESGFRSKHAAIADSVPGYEPPAEVHKRRAKEYSKDGCLTLDEFTAILLKAIIKHNRSEMKGYPLPVELLAEGVRPVPVALWEADLKRRTGALSRYSENHVRMALSPQGKAVVTREGILFRGCYYTCPQAVQRGWFVKAGQGRFSVEVSFDKRLADSIYLHDKSEQSGYIEATLSLRSAEYKGLSFDEVAAYEYMRAQIRNSADAVNAQEKSSFHEFTDPITERAHREMKKATKGKSRKSRKVDIRADRVEERRTRRQEEVPLNRPAAESAEPAEVISLSARAESQQPKKGVGTTTSLAERLRQQRKEMLHG